MPRPKPSPERELQESVTRLQEQLRVLCDIAEELREEVSWAIRNGRAIVLPLGGHDVRSRHSASGSGTAAERDPIVDELCERLEAEIAGIATDQLALFVAALDEARDAIVATVKGEQPQQLPFAARVHDAGPVEPQRVLPTDAAAGDSDRSHEGQGRLF